MTTIGPAMLGTGDRVRYDPLGVVTVVSVRHYRLPSPDPGRKTGRLRYDVRVAFPDGRKVTICGVRPTDRFRVAP